MRASAFLRPLRLLTDYIAVALMATMFVCFLLQIFFRYVLNRPLGWTEEVTVLCWVWVVLWSAAFLLSDAEEVRFDIVFSALTIHHLDGPGKAELFRRVAAALSPDGRFVIEDVVVPENPSDVVTPIDGDYDKPSGVSEQLEWLAQAGLAASVAWSHRDLAVLVGELS